MPRGRSFFGPGFWKGGPGPASWAGGWGGWNPSPFCRFFPWLPKRWWTFLGAGYGAGLLPGPPAGIPDEATVLKQQAAFLQQQIDEINKRLGELGEQK